MVAALVIDPHPTFVPGPEFPFAPENTPHSD
jgi:hypothetical protein